MTTALKDYTRTMLWTVDVLPEPAGLCAAAEFVARLAREDGRCLPDGAPAEGPIRKLHGAALRLAAEQSLRLATQRWGAIPPDGGTFAFADTHRRLAFMLDALKSLMLVWGGLAARDEVEALYKIPLTVEAITSAAEAVG